MKNYLFCLLFLSSIISFGQKQLGELKITSNKAKSLFYINDTKNDKMVYFVTNAKNITAYLLDNNYQVIAQLQSLKERKFKTLLGSEITSSGDYNVYLSNSKKNSFSTLTFSFKNNTVTSKEFTLLRDYERLMQTVSTPNQFFLITAAIQVNNLYIYTFKNGEPKRNIIDLSGMKFLNGLGRTTDFTQIFVQQNPLLKFNENTPNSIKTTVEKRKLYIRANEIIITLDNYSVATQILTINLNNLSASYTSIEKPLTATKRNKKVSNSYLNNDKLYTIAASKQDIELAVVNINDKKVLKSFKAQREDTISFKNSPILSISSDYRTTDSIEKTKKFLRRIVGQKNIGISTYTKNDLNFISIGTVNLLDPSYHSISLNKKELAPTNYERDYTSGFSKTSANINKHNYYFDPIQFAFDVYDDTLYTLQIKSVLDSNFNHLKKHSKINNTFEKIYNTIYPENKPQAVRLPFGLMLVPTKAKDMIFKKNNEYIYSYFDKETNSIKIVSFPN